MSELSRRTLYWTPRALCIAYALFLAVFSLNVFSEGRGFWQTLLALAIHNIPSALIVAILVIAWRREWIGTVLFAAAGLSYVMWAMQHRNWSGELKLISILTIAGPVFFMAALFLVNWLKRAQLHART
jgi:hypothetical protein